MYEKILIILTLLTLSLSLRLSLNFAEQNWANTFTHTLTFLLLPIITYAITSIISNNIALSLGMVGALSIVRFRHPVKSPLELACYFLLISMGITASQDIKWAIMVGLTSICIIAISIVVKKIFTKFLNFEIFPKSFAEGNIQHTLEMSFRRPVESLSKNNFLIFYQESEGLHFYKMASGKKKDLEEIIESMSNNKDKINIIFSVV
jgi:hypothetical protein